MMSVRCEMYVDSFLNTLSLLCIWIVLLLLCNASFHLIDLKPWRNDSEVLLFITLFLLINLDFSFSKER